jgi:endonuclease YncB( thermonuclease family)
MKNLFYHIIKYFSKKETLEEIKDEKIKNHEQKEHEQIKELETQNMRIIKWEDTTAFTMPITGGQVIKVYDGDSITIAGYLPMYNSPLFRFSLRLNGIDTPEIQGKSEDEKRIAKDTRDALANLILHKFVTLKNIQTEKYGRILADVYLGDLYINEWLIKNRYAVKYDGGTKKSPTSWLKYYVSGEI